jgi:hypothetical protein
LLVHIFVRRLAGYEAMITKLKIPLLTVLAVMAYAPAYADGLGYPATGDATQTSTDPIGDSLPTDKFDPAPLVSPLDRTVDNGQRQGAGAAGSSSFALTPSPTPQWSPAGAVAPLSNRLGSRIHGRLATRIDNQEYSPPPSTDPRDNIGADPSDRITNYQNSYGNQR